MSSMVMPRQTRGARRVMLAAVLAAGLAGMGLSVAHPQWFSGSTGDAGMEISGTGGHGHGGPILGGGPIRLGAGSASHHSSSDHR